MSRIKVSQPNVESQDNTEFLYQLSYCSILKQGMSEREILDLVAHAQRSNQANEITGMLMIDQGLVIQWLEGKKSVVRALWQKLQVDSRHHCLVELLHRNFAKDRLFPDWSMHRATRQEMLDIVHSAREKAQEGEPTPWAGAIATMCILIDPQYAKNYAATMQDPASLAPAAQSGSAA